MRVRIERILPFLTLTVFLDLVGFGIVLPLLPSYVDDMGGSPQTVGVLLASFAAAQLVATPVLGRISDRHGRRRVIVLSLAANAIAMFLFALAASRHQLWLLFVSRLLAGLTSGNIGACQAAIADVAAGPARARALGKLGAGVGLGMMLGPWIGGRLSTFGNAAPPIAAGVMALVALAGVAAFFPETNTARVDRERPPTTLRALAANPTIMLVMALYFLTFLYMTNLQTALALLAAERFHWQKNQIADLFGLFGLVSLIMQFAIVGPLAARVRAPHIVLGASLLAAGSLVCIGMAPQAWVMVAGLIGLASALGLSLPLLAALASQIAGPGEQGTVLGFAQSSGSLARTAGPLLWGVLYQHLGGAASFVGGSVAAILACVVSLRVQLRGDDAPTNE